MMPRRSALIALLALCCTSQTPATDSGLADAASTTIDQLAQLQSLRVEWQERRHFGHADQDAPPISFRLVMDGERYRSEQWTEDPETGEVIWGQIATWDGARFSQLDTGDRQLVITSLDLRSPQAPAPPFGVLACLTGRIDNRPEAIHAGLHRLMVLADMHDDAFRRAVEVRASQMVERDGDALVYTSSGLSDPIGGTLMWRWHLSGSTAEEILTNDRRLELIKQLEDGTSMVMQSQDYECLRIERISTSAGVTIPYLAEMRVTRSVDDWRERGYPSPPWTTRTVEVTDIELDPVIDDLEFTIDASLAEQIYDVDRQEHLIPE